MNYIIWRVVKSKIGQLDAMWRDLRQTYDSMNLGQAKLEPRWIQCVSQVQGSLGAALSNVYVKNHYSSKDKEAVRHFVEECFLSKHFGFYNLRYRELFINYSRSSRKR